MVHIKDKVMAIFGQPYVNDFHAYIVCTIKVAKYDVNSVHFLVKNATT